MTSAIGCAIGAIIYLAAIGLVELFFRRRDRRLAARDVAREFAQMIKDESQEGKART